MSNARNLSKFKPSSSGLVETADIADDAITNAKVADDAIDTAQIADNAVANAQMADNAIGTSEIADDAVTAGKIEHNPAIVGNIEPTGSVRVDDGQYFQAGDSYDLQMYHDGSNSYVEDQGTGDLRIKGSVVRILADQINLSNNANTLDGLIMDSAGIVKKPKQPCFSKSHSGNSPTLIDTSGHVIVSMGGTEHFDLGNNVDSIGKFTAPVAGRYMFIMTHYVYAVNASDDSHMYTYFYLNGSANSLGINQAPLQWYRDGHTANSEKQVQHIGFASLSQGDYVQLGFWTSHANIFKHLGAYLSLSGFLVG